jgi:CheY-like chemotaxis protein
LTISKKSRIVWGVMRKIVALEEDTEMIRKKGTISILIAEDDPDEQEIIREAFRESRFVNPLNFVKDGIELMDYLYRRGEFAVMKEKPLPGLILLDLKMPRKDGIEALREIKSDARLRSIPIVVLTISRAEEDILQSYHLGVNSFITKPIGFRQLVEMVRAFSQYWLELVELPYGIRI